MKKTYIIPELATINICTAGIIATSPATPITRGEGVEDERGESRFFQGSLFDNADEGWE